MFASERARRRKRVFRSLLLRPRGPPARVHERLREPRRGFLSRDPRHGVHGRVGAERGDARSVARLDSNFTSFEDSAIEHAIFGTEHALSGSVVHASIPIFDY